MNADDLPKKPGKIKKPLDWPPNAIATTRDVIARKALAHGVSQHDIIHIVRNRRAVEARHDIIRELAFKHRYSPPVICRLMQVDRRTVRELIAG